MFPTLKTLLVACGLSMTVVAIAGDEASPAPPAPPTVDFSSIPDSASVRPIQIDNKAHPVHARLFLEDNQLVAGATQRIGLHLDQDEGWHTYWIAPGDVGQPTEIQWTLPEGFSVEPHTYTIPQRFQTKTEVSFGYNDQVLHIAPITVADTVSPGSYDLKAKANWLVCLTMCIPGEVELTLPVDVAAAGTTADRSVLAPLFDHYTKQHPTPPLEVTEVGWDFAMSQAALRPDDEFKAVFRIAARDGGKLQAHEGDISWPTFVPFVPIDWSWAPDEVKVVNGDDGSILIAIAATAYEPDPLPTDAKIGGLVQVKVDDTWVRTEIRASLPWAAAESEKQAVTSPLLDLAFASKDEDEAAATGENDGVEDDAAPTTAEASGTNSDTSGLLGNLFMAFIGGLILNVMPCVLPVLTLKLYSLVEQTDITAAEQRTAGTAYTGGILASFWLLAGSIVALRSAFGIQVDWGFQFQYPPYVAALAAIVFAFGLSLFGVFEIPAFGAGAASEQTAKEGVLGYFMTGVFATLLATPCSAPFLGTAAAFAFGAPTWVLFAIFTMVGLGLAFPFLVIAFVPAAYRFLPKPGAWMEAFKELLGFSLIATTIWLVSVLMSQIGTDRTVGYMAFLTVLAIGCWIFGRWGGVAASGTDQIRALAMALVVTLTGGWYFVDLAYADVENCDTGEVATDLSWDEDIPWQPFSEKRLAALEGSPVFIDFTADWCVSCKVNEKTVLAARSVKNAMKDKGFVPLKADWTRPDPEITKWLHKYGRAGVPFYLVIPADPSADPIPLPEVITPSIVINALEEAS